MISATTTSKVGIQVAADGRDNSVAHVFFCSSHGDSQSERTDEGEGDGSREDLRSTVPSPFEQPQTYLDILDAAGTDYSPAGRTPPIHN